MLNEIEIKRCNNIEAALLQHELITGSSFFECYENHKDSVIKIAEMHRFSDYLVDIKTGSIYYLTKCPDGLLALNKLALSACLHDGPFYAVMIFEETILIHHDNQHSYMRDSKSRKTLAANKIVVTTL